MEEESRERPCGFPEGEFLKIWIPGFFICHAKILV